MEESIRWEVEERFGGFGGATTFLIAALPVFMLEGSKFVLNSGS